MNELDRLSYPRHVHRAYLPDVWVSQIVADAESCAAALAEGWSLLSYVQPLQEPAAEPPRADSPQTSDDLPPMPPRRPRGWPKGKPRKVSV